VSEITLAEARRRLTLSVPEAASLIHASRGWTYGAVDRGELPSKTIRGRKFVLAAPLLRAFGLDDTDEMVGQ
jgi:hypothetical protein